MKTQLIVLSESNMVIVSDEKIRAENFYIDDIYQVRKSVTDDRDYWSRRKDYRKIIASNYISGLPDINVEGFENLIGSVNIYGGLKIFNVELQMEERFLVLPSNHQIRRICGDKKWRYWTTKL